MPKVLPMGKILESCENGFLSAEKLYKRWSPQGYSVAYAPESLVQIEIAKAMDEHGTDYLNFISLEESEVSILDASNAHHNCKAGRSSTGRIDLVVWSTAREPRVLIETKKVRKTTSCNDDAKRIVHLMKCCPTIQAGIIVGYAFRKDSESLDNYFNSVSEELSRYGFQLKPNKHNDPDSFSKMYGTDRVVGVAKYLIRRDKV